MNNSAEQLKDKLAIDKLTTIFFSIFTNTNEQQPGWENIHHSCIPEVSIIKKDKQGHIVYDLHSFIEPRKQILSDGTLTGFSEREISEETAIIGNIAQRRSRYQKHGYLNGVHFHEYGSKLFQFVKTPGGWRISSIIWEDE